MANWVWNQIAVRFPTREDRDEFARRADGNLSIRELFTGEQDPEPCPEPLEGAYYLFDVRLIGMTGERSVIIEFDTKWGSAHIGSIPAEVLSDLQLLHRYDSAESAFRGFSVYKGGEEVESDGVWNRVFTLPGMPEASCYLNSLHLDYLKRVTGYMKTLTASDLTVLLVTKVEGLIEALPVDEEFREYNLNSEDGDPLYRRLEELVLEVAKESLRDGAPAAESKVLLQLERDVEANIKSKGDDHELSDKPSASRRHRLLRRRAALRGDSSSRSRRRA